jgi:hypothetical protein
MDISEFLSVAKVVLADKRVIGTAIAVFLCMDFGAFVANYARKPPKQKPKQKQKSKSTAAKPSSSSADNEKEGAESSSDGSEPEQTSGAPAK